MRLARRQFDMPFLRGDCRPIEFATIQRLLLSNAAEIQQPELPMPNINDTTRIELEAAAFRRLVDHLRQRTDVQNIDMMNLAGFCRNCLANWYMDAANEKGVALDKMGAREIIYGEPYDQWQMKHQKEASAEKLAAYEVNRPKDH